MLEEKKHTSQVIREPEQKDKVVKDKIIFEYKLTISFIKNKTT